MKNKLTAIVLLFLLGVFSYFVKNIDNSKFVLEFSPESILGIDIDNNKVIDNDEKFCLENADLFSLNPSDEFITKYSKLYNINKKDIISLGYLADDYIQKNFLNKKVVINYSKRVNSYCKFANLELNGGNIAQILSDKGFAFYNDKINKTEFDKNLAIARKLHLVILNHHSGKYHTLDCPYGAVAHDTVIIPEKQLPEDSKPCKFCHKKNNKTYKKLKKNFDIYNIPNVSEPTLFVTSGSVISYITNFVNNLKPNKNCSTTVCKLLVSQINNSKSSIDIAAYGYSDIPVITKSLTNAKNRGVVIRYVYDEAYNKNSTFYKDNNVIIKLSDKSISDRTSSSINSNKLMHNKFIIFDKSSVLTGSMNLSETGLSDYDVNDVVLIKSKDVANLFEKEFEQMLSGKFHTSKNKLNLNNKFKLCNTEMEVYFSPQDKASCRINQIIQGAKKYIYIPAFLITHKTITDELIKAKNRGVDVRIILDANGTSMRNSKHLLLRKSGIPLKTENFAGKLHAKTMVIDDEYTIVGSMNFSNSGENANDENLLIIKDRTIAQMHKNFFLYLWTVIPNKYLKQYVKAESKYSIGSCSDGIDNNFNGKTDSMDPACK